MLLRTLRKVEIETLCGREGADAEAVINFLSSLGSNEAEALKNLEKAADYYGWDTETVEAIRYGIQLAKIN